jgi:hypothetical protein
VSVGAGRLPLANRDRPAAERLQEEKCTECEKSAGQAAFPFRSIAGHLIGSPGAAILARMKHSPAKLLPDTKATEAGASLPPGGVQGRLNPALRKAIDIRVREGLKIADVCRAAGISEAGWYVAMQRPHVQEHYQNVQLQYIQEVEALKAGYKAQAFEVAADLMRNAKSEAIRMRAVEFFAGGPPAPTVNVQVNNAAPGYTYSRPRDRASTSDSTQPIEIEGKADPV